MKLAEILCCCAVLALFTYTFSSCLAGCFNRARENYVLFRRINRDKFLSEGFIKSCSKHEIKKWKLLCRALYPDTEIKYIQDGNFYIQFWVSAGKELRCSYQINGELEKSL